MDGCHKRKEGGGSKTQHRIEKKKKKLLDLRGAPRFIRIRYQNELTSSKQKKKEGRKVPGKPKVLGRRVRPIDW